MRRDVSRSLALIRWQLSRIGLLCDGTEFDRRAPSVSGWSVGQQIDHLGKADGLILREIATALDGGEPARRTQDRLTMTGRALIGMGWLPRGVATAPSASRPGPESSREDVRAALAEVGALLDRFDRDRSGLVTSRIRIRHPYFGGLTPSQWLRFIPVHHHHHLKIVRDILANGG